MPSNQSQNTHTFLLTKTSITLRRNCDVVAVRIKITPALELRVLVQAFHEKCFLHIREFALTNENVFVPTPKGVTIPIEQLVPVLDAVRDLRDAKGDERAVATVPGSGGSEVHFAITRWQGGVKADIRQYFRRGASEDALPTKKGVRLNIGLLLELERGLEALDRELFG